MYTCVVDNHKFDSCNLNSIIRIFTRHLNGCEIRIGSATRYFFSRSRVDEIFYVLKTDARARCMTRLPKIIMLLIQHQLMRFLTDCIIWVSEIFDYTVLCVVSVIQNGIYLCEISCTKSFRNASQLVPVRFLRSLLHKLPDNWRLHVRRIGSTNRTSHTSTDNPQTRSIPSRASLRFQYVRQICFNLGIFIMIKSIEAESFC